MLLESSRDQRWQEELRLLEFETADGWSSTLSALCLQRASQQNFLCSSLVKLVQKSTDNYSAVGVCVCMCAIMSVLDLQLEGFVHLVLEEPMVLPGL